MRGRHRNCAWLKARFLRFRAVWALLVQLVVVDLERGEVREVVDPDIVYFCTIRERYASRSSLIRDRAAWRVKTKKTRRRGVSMSGCHRRREKLSLCVCSVGLRRDGLI